MPVLTCAEVLGQFNNHPDTIPLREALATFIGASGLVQHMPFPTIIENVTNQEWD